MKANTCHIILLSLFVFAMNARDLTKDVKMQAMDNKDFEMKTVENDDMGFKTVNGSDIKMEEANITMQDVYHSPELRDK